MQQVDKPNENRRRILFRAWDRAEEHYDRSCQYVLPYHAWDIVCAWITQSGLFNACQELHESLHYFERQLEEDKIKAVRQLQLTDKQAVSLLQHCKLWRKQQRKITVTYDAASPGRPDLFVREWRNAEVKHRASSERAVADLSGDIVSGWFIRCVTLGQERTFMARPCYELCDRLDQIDQNLEQDRIAAFRSSNLPRRQAAELLFAYYQGRRSLRSLMRMLPPEVQTA